MKSGISRYTLGGFNQPALDDVYNKAKEIYVSDTPPASGLVVNTDQAIWDDMTALNTGWVSNMKSSTTQFQGPARWFLFTDDFDSINVWIEIEEAGDGSGCSTRISQSSNTMVEIGYIRQYLMENNSWRLATELKNTQTPNDLGGNHPQPGVAFSRGCGLDESYLDPAYPNWSLMESEYGMLTNSDGFIQYMPDFYYRNHAWCRSGMTGLGSALQGMIGTCYMRLVLKDPNGIDDRHLANFVAHAGSDLRNDGGYLGDCGISRYKKVTNDWVAMNIFSFDPSVDPDTFADFQALNPPIAVTP